MPINISDLTTTTLRHRNDFVADNITKNIALLYLMEKNGKIKDVGGGRDLTEPLLYNELASKFYDGFESFTIDTSQEVIDAAVYQWKQLGGFSFISGKEKLMNREAWQALSIAEQRIDALIAGLRNKTGASLFSDGSADSGKEFGGLQLLVADDPTTGTVGGIDAAANPFWQNQTSVGAGGFSKDTIQSEMNAMHLSLLRGADQPDLIVANNAPFTAYWETLQNNMRHENAEMADAGFRTLEFIGAPVVFDPQCGADLVDSGGATAGRMYFLNTKYLHFQRAPERWFSTEEYRKVENADYDVIPNWTMGNLTTNARFLQGVISNTG